jgi:hypothetical protein
VAFALLRARTCPFEAGFPELSSGQRHGSRRSRRARALAAVTEGRTMNVGFETIGNATVICHDGGPVLATDPWIEGSAYFGSWTLSHEVPERQKEAIRNAQYLWLSHGHPDHLNGDSLALLKDRKLLIPNHEGGRIKGDLEAQGFQVRVLPDRTWVQLSPRIRVMCLPDYNQDAVLLIDVNGRLVVNLNDAGDRGNGHVIRREIKKYKTSFLLALSGYGDADMINFFTEDGQRILPHASKKVPPGQTIARQAETYGVKFFVPSSSMHKYQRADSLWADEYTTPLTAYPLGFSSKSVELLPAFIRFDCEKDDFERIDPKENPRNVLAPEAFGDSWEERLEKQDVAKLEAYLRAVRMLEKTLDFVTFRVGGEEHRIEFNRKAYHRGITFEVPRTSLMTAVQYEIFDDLLIGNFMKTTMHGEWGPMRLYPDFAPYVAKYADNGRAKTPEQLTAYFEAYRQRDPVGYLRHTFESHVVRPAHQKSADFLREKLGAQSRVFSLAKNAYWAMRRTF